MEKKLGTVRSMRSMVWLRSAFSARVYTQTMYNTVYCFWLFICRPCTVLLMCQKARSCEHGFPCQTSESVIDALDVLKELRSKRERPHLGKCWPWQSLPCPARFNCRRCFGGCIRKTPHLSSKGLQPLPECSWLSRLGRAHLITSVKIIGTSHELTPKGSQWWNIIIWPDHMVSFVRVCVRTMIKCVFVMFVWVLRWLFGLASSDCLLAFCLYSCFFLVLCLYMFLSTCFFAWLCCPFAHLSTHHLTADLFDHFQTRSHSLARSPPCLLSGPLLLLVSIFIWWWVALFALSLAFV